jgi:hypothetical protein
LFLLLFVFLMIANLSGVRWNFNKWTNELNRQFSKEEIDMVNKYMNKCSTSLALKEMQSKLNFKTTFL